MKILTEPDRLKECLCAIALAVLPFVAFLRAALGAEVIGRFDTIFYFLPMRILLGNYLRGLQLPLWNPYMGSGTPFLADVQTAALYPFNLLFALLPFELAHNWIIIFHHSMAAVATFFFARSSRIGRTGAIAAALIFSFSDFMIGYQSSLNVMLASAWLPVVLLAFARMKNRITYGNFLFAAVSMAMLYYAGFPQVSLYILAATFSYVAFSCVFCSSKEQRVRFLLASISSLILALMIAAPQIIPSYELAINSFRAKLSYDQFSIFSIHPLEQLTLAVSRYFFFLTRTIRGEAGNSPMGVELGPFAILLIAFAIARHRTNKALWFWTIIFALAVLLSLGRYTPVHRLFYSIPIYNIFRVPSRNIVIAFFAAAILVGYGLDAMGKTQGPQSLKARLSPPALLAASALALSFGLIYIIYLAYEHNFRSAISLGLILHQYDFPSNVFKILTFLTAMMASAEIGLFLILKKYIGSKMIKGLAISAIAMNFAGLGSAMRLSTDVAYLKEIYDSKPESVQTLIKYGAADKGFRVGSISHESIYMAESQHKLYASLAFPATSAVYCIQSTEIYGPFMLQRYGQLIGATSLSLYEGGFHDDYEIYARDSAVPAILAMRYIVSLKKEIVNPPIEKHINGLGFAKNMKLALKSGESYTFAAPDVEAKQIAIISTIGGGEKLRQGEPFALVEAELEGGAVARKQLLAGIDSADWAIDMPGIAKTILHQKAPAAEDYPSAPGLSPIYSNHSYFSLSTLEETARIKRLNIKYVAEKGILWIFKISIISANGESYPLGKTYSDLSANPALRKIYDDGTVMIYENKASLPRAWLVEEVTRVKPGESEEILRAGKFKDGAKFDPSKTALVEKLDEELLRLRTTPLRDEEGAVLKKFAPNSVRIKAKTSSPRLLVVSEIFYPGWVAYVDGKKAKIHRVNSVLRGVALEEGDHKVAFKFRPKSFYAGLALLTAAIALMAAAKRFFP